MSYSYDRNQSVYGHSSALHMPGTMRDKVERRRNYQESILNSRHMPSSTMKKYCENYYSPDEDADTYATTQTQSMYNNNSSERQEPHRRASNN